MLLFQTKSSFFHLCCPLPPTPRHRKKNLDSVWKSKGSVSPDEIEAVCGPCIEGEIIGFCSDIVGKELNHGIFVGVYY
jgi:hypothetical protein